jgi:hypothetical protein
MFFIDAHPHRRGSPSGYAGERLAHRPDAGVLTSTTCLASTSHVDWGGVTPSGIEGRKSLPATSRL